MELEVAEDRLWRSSSRNFNTGGPVSERAAHGLEAEGRRRREASLVGDPQGGSERAGRWGERLSGRVMG